MAICANSKIMNTNKGQRIGLGCFFVLVLLISCIFILLPQGFRVYRISQARVDPGTLIVSFAKALVSNDISLAKEISNFALHPQLDDWERSHAKFVCRVRFEDIYPEGWLIEQISPSQASYHVRLPQACRNRNQPWHCFIVYDVLVEKNGDSWQVVGWGRTHEAFDADCRFSSGTGNDE